MTPKEMVKELLCPGCVVGSDPNCGRYKKPNGYEGCTGHCLGTRMLPGAGLVALGMPKGFNRPGVFWDKADEPQQPHHMTIRLYPEGAELERYNKFNIPVWALERNGFLFMRIAQLRLGTMMVDVVEGGKASEICPQAIDMTPHYEEYD